jgi:hypothetical protein
VAEEINSSSKCGGIKKNSLSLLEEIKRANDIKTRKQWKLHLEHGILVRYQNVH